MSEEVSFPAIPGYVSIKEAAQILGLAPKTVYQYVSEGRLPGVRASHVLLIPLEEIKKFKPNISGRPRKSVPLWRISPEDNMLLMTLITVQIRANQEKKLMERLEVIRQGEQHLFPGTVARYIVGSEKHPGQVEISLIWRSSVMPDEATREQALEAFRQALADVLDWKTAQYDQGKVFMHT
jgi:excisionase family DNA binding protein